MIFGLTDLRICGSRAKFDVEVDGKVHLAVTPPNTYEIDEETRADLTEVLSLAQRVIDLQYSDEIADELEGYLVNVARAFGIETTKMTVDVSEDGKTYTVTTEAEEPEPTPKWTPTVIEGDKPEA